MSTLNVLTGPLRGQAFELRGEDAPFAMGRGADNIDFRIPDSAISRRHAELAFVDGCWMIRDLDSSNGTYLNEVRIHEPAVLSHHDQVRCGATVLLFAETAEQQPRPSVENRPTDRVELVFDPGETMVAVAFDSLQSKQSAEQKKRMMEAGQAAMNMSHGVKNVLQAVQSGRDVMDEALSYQDIDQAKRAWNILNRNLDRIQKLVLDMLKFSKDETLNIQPCHFNRLVESVVEAVRPQANHREVGIITQIDEDLDMVPVDPEKMQDVIMNLLINATEAVVPKTGQVIVHTERDRDGEHVILRVSDNGPGIEDTCVIFEPFHSTKDNVGAGLGLTIAQKIVHKHHGTIDVQSLPDEGTIFTVRIPAKAQ